MLVLFRTQHGEEVASEQYSNQIIPFEIGDTFIDRLSKRTPIDGNKEDDKKYKIVSKHYEHLLGDFDAHRSIVMIFILEEI
jgi:plasmid maintenance system killer protein